MQCADGSGGGALSAEAWRLLIEAEIDTAVRELRKNALWADAVEKGGLGALWVGGSRWPGAQGPATRAPGADSRRTLGKAGQAIGLAPFADGGGGGSSSSDSGAGDGDETGRAAVLEALLLLREAIGSVSDPRVVDLQAIVGPFLQVIRDPETTGPITRCALVSIQRFVSHGVVDLARADAMPALLDMTQAVTHCRFEATDSASDEAVLMQILGVLSALVLSAGGRNLTDAAVCEIMETVLSMSCQMRISEMLRRAAESTLFTLVTFVFGRLNEIHAQGPADGAAGEAGRFGLPAISELYRVLVALVNPRDLQYTDTMRLLALNTLQAALHKACYAMAEFAALREMSLGPLSHSLLLILQRDQPALISPALRVLYLVFTSHRRDAKGHLELFLCQTLGRVMTLPAVPRGGSRTPLRLGGGPSSGPATPRLDDGKAAAAAATAGAAAATGSRRGSTASTHARSESDAAGRALAALALESEAAPSYEDEVELYNSASLRAGIRGRLATHETRRQLIEGLHRLLTGDDALVTDLWINFDCDMQSGNMFDFVLSLVARRAVPWPDAADAGESEAFLDILLHHVVRVAARAGVAPPAGRWARLLGLPDTHAATGASEGAAAADRAAAAAPLSMAQLQDRKRHKDTMMRAARLFNERPKDGIAYLQRVGTLTPDNSGEMAQQLAVFLRETPTLNKKLLGEYVSKPSNLEVLQAYMGLFDFSGRRVDEALRSLLGTFRLPGESQQIERIMETFAAAYFGSAPADVATKDAAFILAFAIIMLNTDQHSPQVKSRMALDDFARNLRGVNDGQDFSPEFLRDVFDAIRTREIVFPQEHEGEAGFEYAWHEVCAGDVPAGPWASSRGQTAAYDRELLAATWPRLLRPLAQTLARAASDHVLQRALLGLHALAGSAAHYGLAACADEIVRLLAGATGLGRAAAAADLHAPQVLVSAHGRYAVLDAESPASPLAAAADALVAAGPAGAEQRAQLQALERESVQLTQAALELGRDYRAQVAFVALFELVAPLTGALSRQGWAPVLGVVGVAVDADLAPHGAAWVPRIPTLQAIDAARRRAHARRLGGAGAPGGAQQAGGLLSAISSLWGSGSGGSGGSGSGADAHGRRPELRWRASPSMLADLVARSRMAARASAIGDIGALAGRMGASQATFLAALARLFPQPPPSQPGSPADAEPGGGDDAPAAAAAAAEEPVAHYVPSSVFFLELAVSLVLAAPARAATAWPPIEPAVQRMFEYADVLHRLALERAVGGALAMAACILECCARPDGAAPADAAPLVDIAGRILRCLGLLRDVRGEAFDAVAPVLADGLGRLVAADARALFSAPANWGIVRLLLKRLARAADAGPDAPPGPARQSLAVLVEVVLLLKGGAIDAAACFEDALDVLAAFAPSDRALAAAARPAAGGSGSGGDSSSGPPSHMSAVEAASKLVALLHDMQEIALRQAAAQPHDGGAHSPASAGSPRSLPAQPEPSIGSLVSASRVGSAGAASRTTPQSMWVGAMAALAGYACAGSREVRQLACQHIQRAVSAALGATDWVAAAFTRVLFPLMDTLQRADLLADSAMEDTHARCISMLTMVFLHNAARLQHQQDAAGSADAPDGSEDARPNAPLGHVWLRLVGTLAAYIRTGTMAAAAADADKKHGVPPDASGRAAERRRHLAVLGEMAAESAKNCMLVLDSMAIFGEPRDASALWRRSWELLDSADPRLRAHVFPAGDGVPPPPQATPQDQVAPAGHSAEPLDQAASSTGHDAEPPDRRPEPGENEPGSPAAQPPSPDTPRKKHHGRQIIIVPSDP
ncbi:GDP/GTP exchange factor for ARF [Coemansia javaensis]|uniref:GDP/GTP exchange factor for ARF n=1 Tax=Coemansia javaensis TaxID=2761396 RepID=A0A9W8HPW6_9FUNG|nr:GDP/GTP exchange factor for ARF [Coemansia javaensis]